MNNQLLIRVVCYFMITIVTIHSETTYPPIYYYEIAPIENGPIEITTDKYGNIFIKELIDENNQDAVFDKQKFLEYVDTQMKGYSPETKAKIRDRISKEKGYQLQLIKDEEKDEVETTTRINTRGEDEDIEDGYSSKGSIVPATTPKDVSPLKRTKEDQKEDEDREKQLLVDGNVVKEGEYTYHALIYSEQKLNHICSGAMINEKFIITAASCVYKENKNNLRVNTGTGQSTQEYDVSKIYLYDNLKIRDHNIALLKTKKEMLQTKLPDFRPLSVAVGSEVTITGFKCENLRFGMTTITSNDACSKSFSFANEESICGDVLNNISGKKCFEELGSPVIWNDHIVGVVSHSKTGQPSRYMSVDFYFDWIVTKIVRSVAENVG